MKTFLKMGLILSILFCLSPFVSAQFIKTSFIAWIPDGSMIAVGHGTRLQILDANSLHVLNTITGLDEQVTEFGGNSICYRWF